MKPPCLPSKTVTTSYERKTTVESPNESNKSNHVEQSRVTMHGRLKEKLNYNKKKSHNDGNVELKKVMINYENI